MNWYDLLDYIDVLNLNEVVSNATHCMLHDNIYEWVPKKHNNSLWCLEIKI